MTYEEKKQILASHGREKSYYYIILAIIGLNFLYGLYTVIERLAKSNKGDLTGVGILPASMVIVALILYVGLVILYFFGVWRLQSWVTLFMWLGFIGSILSFDLVNIIITGIILFGYKKVLKLFKLTVPPQPNPQT